MRLAGLDFDQFGQTVDMTVIGAAYPIQPDNWLTAASAPPAGLAPVSLIWREDGG